MKIGVIVAMSSEFDLISALLENKIERKFNGFSFVEGNTAAKSVVLLKSGIGKVCSAVGVLEMIKNFQPDCIINTGVAGGIDTALNVADIVVGDTIVYHDVWCGEGNAYGQVQGFPPCFKTDRKLYNVAVSLKADSRILGGMICSGDKFITDRKQLDAIKSDFPDGLAVDMESCSIAQVCYMYSLPFLSIRIISDTPGADGHAEQYRDFWTMAPQRSFKVFKKLLLAI